MTQEPVQSTYERSFDFIGFIAVERRKERERERRGERGRGREGERE